MSVRPADLPLLLAGPVLRRVESDLVCVWTATSKPCNASLLLFDGADVAASDTPLPAPIDFAGMPNPRFWTFEDHAVQFDVLDLLSNPDVEPSPATLMVLDFAMSYSDDWFLVPIVLDTWSIFDATAVAVTDVFGDVTLAGHPEGRWNLFRLDTASDPTGLSHLFLTAGPAESIEGHRSRRCTFFLTKWPMWGGPLNVSFRIRLETAVRPPARTHRGRRHPRVLCGRSLHPRLRATGSPCCPPTSVALPWAPCGRRGISVRPDVCSGSCGRHVGRCIRQKFHPKAQVVRRWQSCRAIDGTVHFWIGRSKTPR
jgi:hypothetical protein